LSTVSFGASHAENVSYIYDETETASIAACGAGSRHGIGRLTRMEDASGTTRYAYDGRGNITCKIVSPAQTLWGTGVSRVTRYEYTASDRIARVFYPSGIEVVYERTGGEVTAVKVGIDGAAPQVVADAITWRPFGPVESLTFGNGAVGTIAYRDSDEQVTGMSYGSTLNLTYAYDKAGNVLKRTPHTMSPGFDYPNYVIDRLDRIWYANHNVSFYEGFSYDATGNRTNKQVVDGDVWNEPGVIDSTSNRLLSYDGMGMVNDPMGNRTWFDYPFWDETFQYGDKARLTHWRVGTGNERHADYRYNGHGQLATIEPVPRERTPRSTD
jgi:YD repeat-containing protein